MPLALITASELLDALPVIASLIVIEGLLSVDNALAIAAMAAHLPGRNRFLALRLGILGAYLGRGIALAFAGWIVRHEWMKAIGAFYLLYLMCAHLTALDDHGRGATRRARTGLFLTVVQLEFLDLSLSLDNVIAAVALSPHFWVVCAGVFIGILVLRFLAGFCLRLIERFPILGQAAFLLVGFIGIILAFEIISGTEVRPPAKFAGISLIIGLSILYSRHPFVHRLFHPIVSVAQPPMRLFATVVDGLAWPFRKLADVLTLLAARAAARLARFLRQFKKPAVP